MSKSPYKLLNQLEEEIQDNYSASILNLSKAILSEIDKDLNKLKNNEII